VIHARRARTFAQARMQSCNLFARSLGQDFNGAIRIVADPAGNLQHVSFVLDKPAETDTLNAAAYKKAASLSDRVIG